MSGTAMINTEKAITLYPSSRRCSLDDQQVIDGAASR